MSTIKFGEVDWSDKSIKSDGQNSKDVFLKLSQGSNVVRLITLPYQYYQHKYKIPDEKGFGHRINCSQANGSCAVCDKSDKPKRRWYLGVIDRKTGQYKILDIGYAVFKGIQTLVNDEDWGSPLNYDVDIKVDPNGGAVGYYAVVGKPKKPLSASDLQIKDANDPERLVKLSTPPTPEKTAERLAAIMDKAQAEMNGGDQSSSLTSALENSDEEFTDFEAQKSKGF